MSKYLVLNYQTQPPHSDPEVVQLAICCESAIAKEVSMSAEGPRTESEKLELSLFKSSVFH